MADANELMDEIGVEFTMEDLDNPIAIAQQVYQLWIQWADFHLYVIDPYIPPIEPPLIIEPEMISETEYEFVYSIVDHGYKLSTSRAMDMFTSSHSLCKLHYTIEKMIFMLIERLKSGGVEAETEVQIAFAGHELAKRKAFESVINLSENVVVTNFEPGAWGEQYLKTVKLLAEKGYGYPSEAPRDTYRKPHESTATTKVR